MFGGLTLRQIFDCLEGAARRDASEVARITRAVWAGTRLKDEGVDQFIASVLGTDLSLPPEQALFALQSTTADLPKINWNERVRAA